MNSRDLAFSLAMAVLATFIAIHPASAMPERMQASSAQQAGEGSLGYPLPLSMLREPSRPFRSSPAEPEPPTPKLQEGLHAHDSVASLRAPQLRPVTPARDLLDEVTSLLEGRVSIEHHGMIGMLSRFVHSQLMPAEIDTALRTLRPGLRAQESGEPDIAVLYGLGTSSRRSLRLSANPGEEMMLENMTALGMGLGNDEDSPRQDYSLSVMLLHPF